MTINAVIPTEAAADEAATREKLVRTAHDLIPLLRDNAERTERDRRLTDEVTDAVRSAGLFQVCTPRASGGFGGGLRTMVEVTAELSRGDGSTGWVAFIANTTAFSFGLFPDDVRAAVYTDPHNVAISQFTPVAAATEVDGGYRLTGKWPFASGSHQAQWTLTAFRVLDNAGQLREVRFALMSAADLTIEDTWYVAGMAGTGSNTYVADDLYVPREFTLDVETFAGRKFAAWLPEEPGYRAPIGTLACLGIVGPLMGMAEGAWDLVLDSMESGRPITAAYSDIRDAPSYRLALADARTAIDTGRFHLLRAADAIDSAAHEGRILSLAERGNLRGAAAVATRSFRNAVDLLLDIGGTRSFALSNPLQRVWRDLEVASRHGLNNTLMNREEYALSLLGMDQAFPDSL
ncbi:acyl-CoA dehydrogenase family protein [Streptomyces sp. NPDC101776]|uniref:acyl-CoA dehydrogenase family protein n=1 Tax=Streptomyces sp. NPDC101776 TaxID=3366146 RepID=UPI0038150346